MPSTAGKTDHVLIATAVLWMSVSLNAPTTTAQTTRPASTAAIKMVTTLGATRAETVTAVLLRASHHLDMTALESVGAQQSRIVVVCATVTTSVLGAETLMHAIMTQMLLSIAVVALRHSMIKLTAKEMLSRRQLLLPPQHAISMTAKALAKETHAKILVDCVEVMGLVA